MSHQSELIAQDINAYLAQHEQKELLRFLTCGSVDDGKSTLIGRLLHYSKIFYCKTQIYYRGYSGSRTVHAQYGNWCVYLRPCHYFD